MKFSELTNLIIHDLEIESLTKLSLDTDITQIEEWDSLSILVLINMVKINFDIDLTTDEIGDSFLIKDLIVFIEKNSNYKISE